MINYRKPNAGEFTEKDFGQSFTYRNTTDPWAIRNGFKHEVDVGYDTRFATVTSSRCHMCIDVDANGKPLVETWKIRNHKIFNHN